MLPSPKPTSAWKPYGIVHMPWPGLFAALKRVYSDFGAVDEARQNRRSRSESRLHLEKSNGLQGRSLTIGGVVLGSLSNNPPRFDFTSSITASQQSTWLPSPAPPALRRTLQQSHSEFAIPRVNSDFVLFDQPAQRPQRAPSAPQLHPTFNLGNLYPNSAPSPTAGFQQPPLQQQRPKLQQRPPVPLFSSTTSTSTSTHTDIQQQQLHIATMAGTTHHLRSSMIQRLTSPIDLNTNNSFDSNLGAGLGPAFASNELEWGLTFPASAFTSINDSAAESIRTVSPKEIFGDSLGSAPHSTAFTNLTSPDIGESPYMINDSFETSPLFNPADGLQGGGPDTWYSLFPEQESQSPDIKIPAPAALNLERTPSSQSMARSNSSSANSPAILDSRRKSSVSSSPVINASISKSRRRRGVLPDITVDPNDKVAMKRARNTLAARDSRQRKFDHVNTLEKRNAELEAEVEKWKNIALAHGYNGA
ncbi:hypothetical protein BU24DRAFT_458637 [Aaosphaeria arxii CBS 175.79]|uniref:BZIP domain-containing protein n=1 Tax=Aaosphaeria arxii CBS 175.79 TaxID=1450172 RepID=A0A6A5Y0X9_9PLEO|nr:uncharacterized protein BU24DRAFT_458637 [Aaosphaeria arxii CBS 175.79]KAF2018909.1 hypothetical protein BU24DRAFT_458637 [Aaosphaeria arxii CBS 175.79]